MDYPGHKTKKLFIKDIGVDKNSIKFLEAMSHKLERDYLSLFNKLIFEYKKGEIKKESQKASDLVLATILIIDRIIKLGIVSKDDEKLIISNIELINEYKKLLINSASKTISFRKRLKRIEGEIGISIDDLTISKSIAKKIVEKAKGGIGVSRFVAKKATRYAEEKALDISQSITTSLFGPFGFMMEDVFKGLKDVLKYSRMRGKKKKEEKLLSSMKERSSGREMLSKPDILGHAMDQSKRRKKATSSVFPYFRIKPKRRDHGVGLMPTEGKKRPFLNAQEVGFAHEKLTVKCGLFQFFNKDAYRAKWTRELLKAVKGEHAGGVGGIGSNLFGLLGKAGQLAALAASIGLTVDQLIKLKNAFSDLEKSKQLENKAADQLIAATKQKINKIKEVGGIEAYGEKVGKTPRQVALDLASARQRTLLDKVHARPWWLRSLESLPFMKLTGAGKIFNPLRREKPFYEQVSEFEKGLSRKQVIDVPATQSVDELMRNRAEREVRLSSKKTGTMVPSTRRNEDLKKDIRIIDLSKIHKNEDHTKEVVTEVKKLNKNLEDWQRRSGSNRSTIDAGRIRDPNDSSDALLRGLNGVDGLRVGD